MTEPKLVVMSQNPAQLYNCKVSTEKCENSTLVSNITHAYIILHSDTQSSKYSNS